MCLPKRQLSRIRTLLRSQFSRSSGPGGQHVQRTRSQHLNRKDVITRFQELLRRALRPRKKRRQTQPSRATKERGMAEKRRRSETKRQRRPVPIDFE